MTRGSDQDGGTGGPRMSGRESALERTRARMLQEIESKRRVKESRKVFSDVVDALTPREKAVFEDVLGNGPAESATRPMREAFEDGRSWRNAPSASSQLFAVWLAGAEVRRALGGTGPHPDGVTKARSVRLSDDEWRTFLALGGARWLRAAIRQAKTGSKS
jgi:hypothetical protein